jgi:hypothetical protein
MPRTDPPGKTFLSISVSAQPGRNDYKEEESIPRQMAIRRTSCLKTGLFLHGRFDGFALKEDYAVDLVGLTALEQCIVPDISGGLARASVAQLCLA